MLTVTNITKSFGFKPVLQNVQFRLNAGEKLGLVGLNGCGKTTLLQIIAGELKPDQGTVTFTSPGMRVGYLRQGLVLPEEETIDTFINNLKGDSSRVSCEFERLSRALAENPGNLQIVEAFDRALAVLLTTSESTGGVEHVLAMLGLGDIPRDQKIRQLSGGQKTRLGLASVLLNRPDLLLLDEPTNHLDIQMLEWLEGWLKKNRSAVLLVSHDRTFLDDVVDGILELDEHTHTVEFFSGNYSDYLQRKRDLRDKQWQDFSNQQDEIRRLRKAAAGIRDLARYHRGGKTDPARADGFSIGYFANRGKETVQRARNIEKRIDHLLTDVRVEKPSRTWQLKVDFDPSVESGRDVLVLDDLSIGYNNQELAGPFNLTVRFRNRVIINGANGCGKSTLLKTIIGLIPPITGFARLGSGVKTGYMAQEQETLDGKLNVLETIMKISNQSETEIRSFLSKYLFMGDEVFTTVGKLSYGERVRLLLACNVADGCNFLILDEPINHLDIPSRERFEQALACFPGTVMSVVHDRAFIKKFGQILWKMENGRITVEDNRPIG